MGGTVRARERWLWFGGWYVSFVVGYCGAALFPFAAPRLAPSLAWEPLPLQPWAIWLYLSHFLLVVLAMAFVRERAAFMALIKRMAAASAIAFGIFFAWPTTLPRVVVSHDGLTGQAWSLLHRMDVPANCMPSLHVALALICLHALGRGRSHTHQALLTFWGLAIAVSTMLTGQHVLLDVLAGGALGVVVLSTLPTPQEESEEQARQPCPQADPDETAL